MFQVSAKPYAELTLNCQWARL